MWLSSVSCSNVIVQNFNRELMTTRSSMVMYVLRTLTLSGDISHLWDIYELFREIKKVTNVTTQVSNMTKKSDRYNRTSVSNN